MNRLKDYVRFIHSFQVYRLSHVDSASPGDKQVLVTWIRASPSRRGLYQAASRPFCHRLFAANKLPFPAYFIPTREMSHHSPPSRFRVQFESALREYQKQTKTSLASHPLAEQLRSCDSVESVTMVLQDQARASSELRDRDGRIMKSLGPIVSVLYAISASIALDEAIGLVCRDTRLGTPRP
jgi:hypothetical protein